MIKRIATYCILFISAHLLGQNEKVELSINPNSVEVGEVFSITITSTESGTFEIENLPAAFVQDYSINQGSTHEMDYNTGEVKVIYFITYTGTITKAGDYTIGPAWLNNGNRALKSNKVDIKVRKKLNMSYGNVTAQQLNDPAFGVIECNKKEIYEGEPLLLSAKIYASYEPSHISGYQSYHINSTSIKHPVGNSTDIRVVDENFKGHHFRAFNYDKNVVFPDAVGNFQVDPFKLNLHQNYRSFPIVSSGLKVNVKPLPPDPPTDFIGAVGVFELECSVDTNRIDQGDVVRYTLTVKGTGNLHNLLEPQLALPKGFVVYGDPVPSEDFIITSKGAEGTVSFEYNIQITDQGDLQLPVSSISYFDPEKEKYVQISTDKIDIKVKKNSSFQVNDSQADDVKSTEMIVHNTSIRTDKRSVNRTQLYGQPLFWTGVSLPLMSALFFVLFINKRRKNEDKIKLKENMRERNRSLDEQIAKIKVGYLSADNDQFFAMLEQTIRMAVANELHKEDGEVISKNEISDYLNQRGLNDIEHKVKEIFSIAEQSRFGFGANPDTDRDKLVSELEEIINKIRS